MIISREREKLLNAIVFFCKNTRYCHTLKLFKLLNFLDFEHFRQSGRTVTGLKYQAFENGPVPASLWQEMRVTRPASDLAATVAVLPSQDELTGKITRRDIRPKVQFNSALFTRRELDIMTRLAEMFYELRGEDMSEFSHMRGLPWAKVYRKGEGRGADIPEELALSSNKFDESVQSIEPEEIALRNDLRKGIA